MLYLLPGRHQPPHHDHLVVIRAALSRIAPEFLYLGLIVSPPATGADAGELEAEARRQNDPARTPFTFDQRRQLIEAAMFECLLPEESARVRIVPLPRPEAHWPLIETIFPEARTWIVPDAGERFDEMKTAFFRERGDRVLRIRFREQTNGRLVRSLIVRSDPALAEHVPRGVFELIEQWKENG
jgi:nicotinamide mononucleotide adenylyltransferase